MITEERDRLKDVIKELKEHKDLEGGSGLVSGTIFQVRDTEIHMLAVLLRPFCILIQLSCGQELEISLVKKENYVRQLENSLSEIKESNSRQHNEIMLLNERLTNEGRRVKMLEREGDRLRSEISLLESKVCVQGKCTLRAG